MTSRLLSLLTMLTLPAFAAPKALNLETLVEGRDYESGCGCSVEKKEGETLLFSDLEDGAPAIVRINGERKVLLFVSTTEKSGPPKLGDTFARVYGDANYKLRLSYKTKFVCGKKDESCEVTRYSVDTSLEDGTTSTQMKKLAGDCGC